MVRDAPCAGCCFSVRFSLVALSGMEYALKTEEWPMNLVHHVSMTTGLNTPTPNTDYMTCLWMNCWILFLFCVQQDFKTQHFLIFFFVALFQKIWFGRSVFDQYFWVASVINVWMLTGCLTRTASVFTVHCQIWEFKTCTWIYVFVLFLFSFVR